jgi:methanol---5-hydroxybenzimidazolylcobamide Co-methyltransferase
MEMMMEPMITRVEDLIYGRAPRPVRCGLGPLEIGGGTVVPEVNYTLPTMEVSDATWPKVVEHYREMVSQILARAVALRMPGLVLEFEHLPPMTERPEWGAEITRLTRGLMEETHAAHGLPVALRVTPVDLRDATRPPRLRTGEELPVMLESFRLCAEAGADILSIESVGGKEINDAAMVEGDLIGTIAGTAVLGARDVAFLWDRIAAIAQETGTIAGGDTACGFANTAMVLADRGMLPGVFASVVRALGAVRTAAAHEHGAVGPTKDCAYEGPVLKALFGVPISMEGKSAACAHLSHVGNVAAACADLWSNESVQNVRLLAGTAPEVFAEILAYDCRLMNEATARGEGLRLQGWLVASDAPHNPQAFILTPEASLALARAIAAEEGHLARARAAAQWAIDLLRTASDGGTLSLEPRERVWFDRLQRQLDALPETEVALAEQVQMMRPDLFDSTEYGL